MKKKKIKAWILFMFLGKMNNAGMKWVTPFLFIMFYKKKKKKIKQE